MLMVRTFTAVRKLDLGSVDRAAKGVGVGSAFR